MKWFWMVDDTDMRLQWWFPGEFVDGASVRYTKTFDNGVVTSEGCELYTVNSEGDAFFHGLCDDPQAPELTLDAPLWVGKSWEYCILGSCFEMVVVGQESITVPFGGPWAEGGKSRRSSYAASSSMPKVVASSAI